MVFSSFPVYVDHPNWHQLQETNHQQGSGNQNPQIPQPTPPPQVGGGSGGLTRPGSMVDRARVANLPLPEAGLKCPRCDSTNTKFCYFNNYNLTQPRHFCKTCRRYWTRGGALRSVPVGGGCRRNKRSKSSSSKSTVTTQQKMTSNSTSTSPSSCSREMTAHFPQTSPQLPLFSTFQNPSQYHGNISGSNIYGFQPQTNMGFQMGNNSGENSNILSAGGAGQSRFPFLAGFDPPSTVFPYQSEAVERPNTMVEDSQLRLMTTNTSGVTQLAPVKMEGNQGSNVSRQFLGNSEHNQYWGGNAWAEFSGINSSSINHFL